MKTERWKESERVKEGASKIDSKLIKNERRGLTIKKGVFVVSLSLTHTNTIKANTHTVTILLKIHFKRPLGFISLPKMNTHTSRVHKKKTHSLSHTHLHVNTHFKSFFINTAQY